MARRLQLLSVSESWRGIAFSPLKLKSIGETNSEYTKQLKKAVSVLKRCVKEEVKDMNELTLSGLVRMAESEYAKVYAEYLIVIVEGATPLPEIIINPYKNFDSKIAYYKQAYNEDLTLKANPSIRITHYDFVLREELQTYF